MTDGILTAAGIQARRGRFVKPPQGTYALWFDDVDTDGPDGLPWILHHAVTIELYESGPDDAAEKNLEAELTAAGVQWTKQDRVWLQTEQLYQVIYEYDYYEKRRT